MNRVQQGVQRGVHVHPRRALRLISGESIPMPLAISTLIGDDQGMRILAGGDAIHPLQDVLKAHLLRRKVDGVGVLGLTLAEASLAD